MLHGSFNSVTRNQFAGVVLCAAPANLANMANAAKAADAAALPDAVP